ncbi:MAG TPA: HU family DNA-binding protein [Candidatus Polarisedimenticolia bacterium]|jgi:DNA-binding protein HU-beta|nr:HU family DNA-binding protein [Candidatus Polarisedimenticolia bacterium]
MTRTDLIEAIAQETGGDRQQAKGFLEGFTRIIEREMKNEGEVPLAGLGKFKVVKRQARTGRNPMTGESIQIPAKTVVKFTVAKVLKDSIKK